MRYPKLAIAGAILLLLLGGVAWIMATTSGLRFVATLAQPHVPLSFDPAAIEGRLVGPLSLGPIELDTPGVTGSIARVDLDWRLAALLNRRLHVRSLHVEAPLLDFHATAEPEPPSDPADELRLDWSVVLERVSLRNGALSYEGAPLVEALAIDLSAQAADTSLEISRLELRSVQGDLSGDALLSWAEDGPWDVDLDWGLRVEEHSVSGRTRVTGSLAELAVTQEFAAPMESRIHGSLRGLTADPAWDLDVEVDPLPAHTGPWPEILDGTATRLKITGQIAHSRVIGQVELPELVPGRVDIDLIAGWENGVASLRELELRLADGGRITGSGEIVPGADPTGEFALEGTNLGWPLGDDDREVELPRLRVHGTGVGDQWRFALDGRAKRQELPEIDVAAVVEWFDSVLTIEQLELASTTNEIQATGHGVLDLSGDRIDYRLVTEIHLRLPEQPAVDATLEAEGDTEGVRIETLEAELLGGKVEGSGRIAWGEGEAADFHLTFSDLDPSGIAPDWPGQLAGVVELRGLPDSPDGLELMLSSLRGQLREHPVSGNAALNLSGEVLLLRHAALALGSASFAANGRLDEDTVTLDANLEVPTLEILHDAARGRMTAVAHVDGPRNEPRVRLNASGESLRWDDARAHTVHADALLDLAGIETSHVRVTVDGIAAGAGPGGALRLAGEGTPGAHEVRLEYEQPQPDQRIKLQIAGGVENTHWSGRLAALELAADQQQVWTLRQPAPLEASDQRVSLDDACMAGTFGELCLQAVWHRGGPWHGSATLAELDLGPLSDFFLPEVLASGVVTGQLVVEADDEMFRSLSGRLDLTAGDLRIGGEETSPLFAWEGGFLRLEGDENEARGLLDVALAGGDIIEGSLSVGWNAPDPPLEGQLEIVLDQLYLITELVPDLADLEGEATLRASVSGSLSEPQVLGRFEWLNGMAQIPTLGLRPQDINVVAELENAQLNFQASGRSGDGAFRADGSFDLGAEAVVGQAELRGEDLLLADLPEARIAASPELRLSYSAQRIVISGEVIIPSARISGLAAPTAITASVDEAVIGPRARTQEEALEVISRVRVTLGEEVEVRAAGLRGRVEGNILTVTQPEALPWGRGELRVVDGTFSIFGQSLEIDTGRLIYTGGPLENPGLDIRAVRRVDEITAGALVRGTLQNPEVSLYSDPPMSRAETLSYLTIGKGLDDLEAGEQSMVNQAANSLALAGGGLIARDLGRRLGFDDVAVAADDEGTALVVGRYLGSGLYVSYGLGLFDTVNTLRMRYQISRRLSVEAFSGAEAAADFFYTFERN